MKKYNKNAFELDINGNIRQKTKADKPKTKAKPQEWIEDPQVTEYRKKRDRLLYPIFVKNNDVEAMEYLKAKYNF
jgi:hypothetical protein